LNQISGKNIFDTSVIDCLYEKIFLKMFL
jgi:hypothetical protein